MNIYIIFVISSIISGMFFNFVTNSVADLAFSDKLCNICDSSAYLLK